MKILFHIYINYIIINFFIEINKYIKLINIFKNNKNI